MVRGSSHLLIKASVECSFHFVLSLPLPSDWLKTNPNPGKTQSMSSTSTSQGTSQPLSASNDQPVGNDTKPSPVKKPGSRRVSKGRPRRKKKAAVEEKTQSEESGEYGPRASSPVQRRVTS